MLLVLGTAIDSRDRSGNVVTDESGNPVKRSVAQRFVVIKLDDENNPVEARELYVGQIVKTDVNGAIAWPSPLANALRRSSAEFTKAICEKVLAITDQKQIDARTWDDDAQSWKRDADGNLVPGRGTALKFVAEKPAMTAAQLKTAKEMLYAAYVENYSDYINAE